ECRCVNDEVPSHAIGHASHDDVAPESGGKFRDEDAAGETTRVEMVNVFFRIDRDVGIHLRELHGAVSPTVRGRSPVFEQRTTYDLIIDAAETDMTPEAMTTLMNRYVYEDENAPMK